MKLSDHSLAQLDRLLPAFGTRKLAAQACIAFSIERFLAKGLIDGNPDEIAHVRKMRSAVDAGPDLQPLR